MYATELPEQVRQLILETDPERLSYLITELCGQYRNNLDDLVNYLILNVDQNFYDGSKWSSIAFYINDYFKQNKLAERILYRLVEAEPENAAYLNNMGVILTSQKLYGSAILFYAKAYAIDYFHRGSFESITLPAYKNMFNICGHIDKRKNFL